jgi:hypothetical protein
MDVLNTLGHFQYLPDRVSIRIVEGVIVIHGLLFQLLTDLRPSAIVLECRSSCMAKRGKVEMTHHVRRPQGEVAQTCDQVIAMSMLLDRNPVGTVIYNGIVQSIKLTILLWLNLCNNFSATSFPRSSPLKTRPNPPEAMQSTLNFTVTPVMNKDFGMTGVFDMTLNMNLLARRLASTPAPRVDK